MDRPERQQRIEKLEQEYGLAQGHLDTSEDRLLRVVSAMQQVIKRLAENMGLSL